jgi:hypothetical protein
MSPFSNRFIYLFNNVIEFSKLSPKSEESDILSCRFVLIAFHINSTSSWFLFVFFIFVYVFKSLLTTGASSPEWVKPTAEE